MANYKETAVAGSSYTRSCRVIINNQYQSTPYIIYEEERVTILADQVITQPSGSVEDRFTDPATTFPLVDPTTGASLGDATYGQVYVLLHSLYLYLATQRDGAMP